jgi:hypothetical protein
MFLDCSSFESTKNSVIDIFNTSEETLFEILRTVDPFGSNYEPPDEVLYKNVCAALGVPNCDIDVIWFHGTRVENVDLIHERGLLTKTKAREFIEPRLKELAVGLESFGENPYQLSLSGKDGPHDEGPFAFLIRSVAIYAPASNHNYLDAPELVEDIAGILLGQNCETLVDRFKEITKPCIVSFVAEQKGYELSAALWYLKLVVDGDSDLEAANSANTFFDSEGVNIAPDRIQKVELIQCA